ncbi:hypothetical protein NM688_g1314 [Phlebia brevispora]|uniref:Uncharacterized protein n=1 Tax=Phlebia brevispora TaxID=194682 RepID=A0ACC1TBM7_9APHY|nr:hypothetical protein NM688_g1314 [Phlebia brevispora]
MYTTCHMTLDVEHHDSVPFGYVIFVSATLTCYELIAGLEYDSLFLKRYKWTASTWIFLLNRYCLSIATVMAIFLYKQEWKLRAIGGSIPDRAVRSNVCTYIVATVVGTITTINAAVFSALRIYALLGRNVSCSLSVLACGLVPAAAAFYELSMISAVTHGKDASNSDLHHGPPIMEFIETNLIYFSYKTYIHHNLKVPQILTAASAISLIVADVAVIVVTWLKTYREAREAASLNVKGLSRILLQDGTIYFLASQVGNIAQLNVTYVRSSFSTTSFVIAAMAGVLRPILISRFIIDLRRADADGGASVASFSRFTIPNFTMPIMTQEESKEPTAAPPELDETDLREQATDIVEVDRGNPGNNPQHELETEPSVLQGIHVDRNESIKDVPQSMFRGFMDNMTVEY